MRHSLSKMEKKRTLSEVALGNITHDTAIANGNLFNAFTGEFINKKSICIKNGMVAYVGPDHSPPKDEKTLVIDADGIAIPLASLMVIPILL